MAVKRLGESWICFAVVLSPGPRLGSEGTESVVEYIEGRRAVVVRCGW